MIFARQDPRVEAALQDWRAIAPELGLDAEAFRSKLIWEKNEATRSHVVLRLKGPRRLILKRVFKAPSDEDLSATLAALRNAHERLKPFARAHAPEVLYASEVGDVVVMTEMRGKTLNDHLTSGRDAAPLLTRAGAWLDAFHRSGAQEARTYQPKFMVRHVARMAEAVGLENLTVAEPAHFLALCEKIPGLASACEDQTTLSATKHGDFNLRNIILGPDGETGLDFKPPSSAPVGFDIVRMLMDYAELFQPQSAEILSPDTLNAFFDGYRLVDQSDPAVHFLPAVQILNDWRLIPWAPERRSWRQARRLKAILRIANQI